MTNEQKEAVKNAQMVFVAALDAGVEEDTLIEAVFDASNEWLVVNLKPVANQEKNSVSK